MAKKVAVNDDVQAVIDGAEGWGAAFRALREQAGFSQEALADRLGCDRTTLSHWESERFRPDKPTLQAALSALDVSAKVLYQHFGNRTQDLIKAQVNTEELAVELGRTLLQEAAGRSRHDVAMDIVELLDTRILASVGLRALHNDVAAKLWVDWSSKIKEEARTLRQRLEGAIDITPSAGFVSRLRSGDSQEISSIQRRPGELEGENG